MRNFLQRDLIDTILAHKHRLPLALINTQPHCLPLFFAPLWLPRPAEWALEAQSRPWSCPNSQNEGLGKFLALLSPPSQPGEQVQHSALTRFCVDQGHGMAAQQSLPVTLPFLPSEPHRHGQQNSQPSCTTGCPFTRSISWGQPQSASDDAHLCVWAGRYPANSPPPSSEAHKQYSKTSSNTTNQDMRRARFMCKSTKKKKKMLPTVEGKSCVKFKRSTLKSVQGISNSLQITADTSKYPNENDLC